MDTSNVEARAKTLYNKLPGVLTFTNTRILWTKDGHSKPTVNVAHSKLSSMFASKPGVPKKRLRLHVADQPEPFQFSFTSAPAVADAELEKFKSLLAAVVSANTNTAGPSASLAPPPPKTAAPSQSAGSSTPAVAAPAIASPYARASPSPYSRSPSAPPTRGGQYSSEVYQRVLIKNHELADLHRVLVESGQITEQEFWEGREALLDSEASLAAQRKGKSSEIVAPRLKTGENGQILLTLTPQLLGDIFEEFPIVLQAYSDNVPNTLSEAQFWERYFSSKLFDRHRASSRNSVAKEDPIFDKYLEREDDDVEPLHEKSQRVQLLLDLQATEVDHGETGNDKDVTMRAGKRKNAIPMIRRFNEHSERLLQSALGESSTSHPLGNDPKDFVADTSDYYSQIDLDDLHLTDTSDGIALNVQNARRFMDGLGAESSGSGSNSGVGGKANGDAMDVDTTEGDDIAPRIADSITGWTERLSSFSLSSGPGQSALQDMTANVNARHVSASREDEIPPLIMQQITTCSTATNEFLRQFWSALHPPSDSSSSTLTAAQREMKAVKMVGYIARTREKVGAVILTAQHAGVELRVVESAFAPLLVAVDKALTTFEARRSR